MLECLICRLRYAGRVVRRVRVRERARMHTAQEIIEAGMLGGFREIRLLSTGELVIKVCKDLRLPVHHNNWETREKRYQDR